MIVRELITRLGFNIETSKHDKWNSLEMGTIRLSTVFIHNRRSELTNENLVY